MSDALRPLAMVTGASTGIGFELARQCARNGFDLVIAANESGIHAAAEMLRREGGRVDAVEADLATTEGCDKLITAAQARNKPIDALLANAGIGLGDGFFEQDFDKILQVVNTNVTGSAPAWRS